MQPTNSPSHQSGSGLSYSSIPSDSARVAQHLVPRACFAHWSSPSLRGMRAASSMYALLRLANAHQVHPDEADEKERGHHAHDPAELGGLRRGLEGGVHGVTAAVAAGAGSGGMAARPSRPRRWRYAITATISLSGVVVMPPLASRPTIASPCDRMAAGAPAMSASVYGRPTFRSARSEATTSAVS